MARHDVFFISAELLKRIKMGNTMARIKELEEIKTNFNELLNRPGTNHQFKDHYESVYGDGALDSKTKRLIALCGGIIAGCKGCILGQADHAISNGATTEEILEVCSVSLSLGGTLAGSQISMLFEYLKEKGML